MSVNIDDFAILGNKLFAVSSVIGFSGWYYADIPDSLEPPVWNKIVTPDTNGQLRPIGNMAYQVVDEEEVFWVDAILCNSSAIENVNPFAIYVDPRDNSVNIKEWTNVFPDAEDGTPDSMPRAGRCVMWGDYLVLGDIIWKADSDESFTNSNKSRYSHGLWFSKAGKTDSWDPIDTVFTGQKSGGNVVQGMYPLESGLFVITCTLVALLQGDPSDFVYRELREGISNCGRNGNAAWPAKGGVVWNDRQGYVWFSNGEIFQRLDEAVVIEGRGAVAAVGEYVFVSTVKNTHVFRLYEESGGWTRLTGTSGLSKIVANQRFFFGLEEKEAEGSFILDSETNGILDGNDVLWDADKLMAAFDFLDKNRGRFNNRRLRSIIRSRPLPGFGHSVRFWHRFGVRAKGDGFIVSATSRPSADPQERGLTERVQGSLSRRSNYIFDAHGPSFEATFDVEFSGDVTVEHMTVWEHGGRLER